MTDVSLLYSTRQYMTDVSLLYSTRQFMTDVSLLYSTRQYMTKLYVVCLCHPQAGLNDEANKLESLNNHLLSDTIRDQVGTGAVTTDLGGDCGHQL